MGYQDAVPTSPHEAQTRLTDSGWSTVSGGLRPEAKHGTRSPDLVMERRQQQIAIQVGRTTKGGTPVIRERRAMNDLRAAGDFDHVFFLRHEP